MDQTFSKHIFILGFGLTISEKFTQILYELREVHRDFCQNMVWSIFLNQWVGSFCYLDVHSPFYSKTVYYHHHNAIWECSHYKWNLGFS